MTKSYELDLTGSDLNLCNRFIISQATYFKLQLSICTVGFIKLTLLNHCMGYLKMT